MKPIPLSTLAKLGYVRLGILLLTFIAGASGFILAMNLRAGAVLFALVSTMGLLGYALHRALPVPQADEPT